MVMDEETRRTIVRAMRERALFEMMLYSVVLVLALGIDFAFATVGLMVALGIALHHYRLTTRNL
jgi:uncharacterized membrane protein